MRCPRFIKSHCQSAPPPEAVKPRVLVARERGLVEAGPRAGAAGRGGRARPGPPRGRAGEPLLFGSRGRCLAPRLSPSLPLLRQSQSRELLQRGGWPRQATQALYSRNVRAETKCLFLRIESATAWGLVARRSRHRRVLRVLCCFLEANCIPICCMSAHRSCHYTVGIERAVVSVYRTCS